MSSPANCCYSCSGRRITNGYYFSWNILSCSSNFPLVWKSILSIQEIQGSRISQGVSKRIGISIFLFRSRMVYFRAFKPYIRKTKYRFVLHLVNCDCNDSFDPPCKKQRKISLISLARGDNWDILWLVTSIRAFRS